MLPQVSLYSTEKVQRIENLDTPNSNKDPQKIYDSGWG